MAVAIAIVLAAIAIVAHVPNAHVGQPRHFRASVSVLVVTHLHHRGTRDVVAKDRLMHRYEKRVCLAPLRHRSFLLRTLAFVVPQSNANGRVAQLEVDTRPLLGSKWALCSTRSCLAQLEVGTCRRERNSKRTLAQTLAQLRNLLKWTLADTCSSVTLAHLDICSHGLHWTLATTRPTTTTTTNDHGLDPPPSLWSILLLLST